MIFDTLEARFLNRIVKTDSCWLWKSGDASTYRLFWIGERNVYAHRWSYEHFVGPIPEGLEIDHLCRVRNCVNPQHLEAVTHQVNMERGTAWDYERSKTHCSNGHPFDEANTYWRKTGGRQCRACAREEARRQHSRRKLAS